MMILQRLLKREATVEATAERTETDWRARLAEIQAELAEGTGDTLALLEERDGVTRAIEAAKITRQQREQREFRAARAAEGAELRGRVHASLDELGDLVPRLMLACGHFTTLANEVQARGVGFEGGLLEDHFGVPVDFGARLIAAIHEIAPRTQWDWGHTGLLGKGVKAERPKLTTPTIRVPRFAGDNAPPPGFSGLWDVLRGRPVDEGEVPPVTFPPLR